jgi:FtsP/CotA-like multicopper oxidase with cupredoxin domain
MRTFDSTLRWAGVSDYITTSGTSQQSAVFGANTSEIRVVCIGTNFCYINIGANPTAAATDNNSIPLPANVVEYFHVTPGQRVAVLQDTGASLFCVAEMTR